MNILSRIRDIRPRVKYMMSRIRDNRPMSVKNNRAVLDRLVLPPDEGEPNAAECFVHNY